MTTQDLSLSNLEYGYIKLIRKRLWCGREVGRAAVMVGAGFSRNARRTSQRVPTFPLWGELASTFYRGLYPAEAFKGGENHKANKITNSGALSIAQEYEASFGRQALEELIEEALPDTQYLPDSLHQLLLSLPWSDVFTTNYDTILERTQLEVPERKYDLVLSPSDIPVTMKPRIVKLHGSFPAQRPFIVTTEDYRTYPVRFAPFVNMVQQSMMENAFCLLGFSGDDPNFLNWIGWVRDNLREHVPTIFLCGLLDLSSSERNLLADKNISLIDLSPKFPKEKWPDPSKRHRAALEWFLKALHAGKPANELAWPVANLSEGTNKTNAKDFLIQSKAYPNLTRSYPPFESLTTKELTKLRDDWRTVRDHYPGWEVAPRKCRDRVWDIVEPWIWPVLNAVNKELTGEKRISILWELNWLLEISLTPLIADWIKPITEALQSEVPFEHLVHAFGKFYKESNCAYNSCIDQGQWVGLAFAVLKYYRRVNDEKSIDFWTEIIETVTDFQAEWKVRLCYEKCIYHLYRFEHDEALKHVRDWPQISDSIFWEIRKASILSELGELQKASEITEETLKKIRSLQQPYRVDLKLLSQEGWAMFLSKAIKDADLMGDRDFYPEYRDRWDYLRSYQCDPWSEFDTTTSAKELETRGSVFKKRGFDPKRYSQGFSFTNSLEISRFKPYLQLLMLFEEAGVPFRCGGVLIMSEEVSNAASKIYPMFPFWSLKAIVRTGKKDIVSEVFTRARIGSLAIHQVEYFAKLAVNSMNSTIEILAGNLGSIHDMGQKERSLLVLSELLSRLCTRFDDDQLSTAFELAKRMYVSSVFTKFHSLHKCVEVMFERILSYASEGFLKKHINTLISLPIPGDNGFNVAVEELWPEPMYYIGWNKELADFSKELIIPEQVERLFLLGKGTTRDRAISRLIVINSLGLLNNEQRAKFAEVIWSETNSKTGLAKISKYSLTSLLVLPSPPSIAPKSLFLEYLRQSIFVNNVKKTDKGVTVAGGGSDQFKYALIDGVANFLCSKDSTRITMTLADKKVLLDKWVDWWMNEKHALKSHDVFGTVRHELKMMLQIFAIVIMPELNKDQECSQKVVEILGSLSRHDVLMERLVPCRLLYDLEEADAKEILEKGLSSDSYDRVIETLAGIYYWYVGHKVEIFPSPPPSLLDSLIGMVLMCRTPCLERTIDYLRVLLREVQEVFDDGQIRYLNILLVYLLSETDLSKSSLEDCLRLSLNTSELPGIRRAAAELSLEIERYFASKDQKIPSICFKWKEAIKRDTLPEIRILKV